MRAGQGLYVQSPAMKPSYTRTSVQDHNKDRGTRPVDALSENLATRQGLLWTISPGFCGPHCRKRALVSQGHEGEPFPCFRRETQSATSVTSRLPVPRFRDRLRMQPPRQKGIGAGTLAVVHPAGTVTELSFRELDGIVCPRRITARHHAEP